MSNRRMVGRGFTLVEIVVFIVVLAVGFAAMLVVFNQVTRGSVDPVVRKQALAIATSVMEEIQLRGFTYCDPDDANVVTAANAAGCASLQEVVPNPPGTPNEQAETRYATPRFDNVNDYHGFAMSGSNAGDPNSIRDATGTTISGLDGYSVAVTVTNIAAGEIANVASTDDALRVTVSVSAPAGVSVSLQGYRLRYAPNSP